MSLWQHQVGPTKRPRARRAKFVGLARQQTPRGERLAAGLTAAAAVAAVAAVITLIGTSAFAVGLPAPKQAAGSSAGLTAASRGALRGVPPYYLALVSFGKPVDSFPRMEGQIRATATGKIIAVVHPPGPFGTLSVITGGADDRTFVLAAQKTPYPPNQPVKYFLARFHPASGQVTVRPLAIPETPARDDLMGIDLSPDGADLAVAVTTGSRIQDAKVSIYSLRTGRSRRGGRPQG